MATVRQLTAVVESEGHGYLATCPELDIVSQGDTIEEARRNLVEADGQNSVGQYVAVTTEPWV